SAAPTPLPAPRLRSLLLSHPPPPSTLFPYTTLFRSPARGRPLGGLRRGGPDPRAGARARGARGDHRQGGAARTPPHPGHAAGVRSEEHTSELQSRFDLVCRLLLEKKKMTVAPRCADP